MLIAVFIPRESVLAVALAAPVSRQAIAAGFGLYTDGIRTALLPHGRPGWFRMAVTIRDLLPLTLDDMVIA